MLNPFPDLLNFSLLVPTLLRIFLGGYFLLYSYSLGRKIWTEHILSHAGWTEYATILFSFVAGTFVLVGFLTQIGTLILSLLIIYSAFSQKRNYLFLLSLFVMSLSLLISGAGLFAFDIPL